MAPTGPTLTPNTGVLRGPRQILVAGRCGRYRRRTDRRQPHQLHAARRPHLRLDSAPPGRAHFLVIPLPTFRAADAAWQRQRHHRRRTRCGAAGAPSAGPPVDQPRQLRRRTASTAASASQRSPPSTSSHPARRTVDLSDGRLRPSNVGPADQLVDSTVSTRWRRKPTVAG